MTELLVSEIWKSYRPYAKVFLVDLLVAVSLWGLLALFTWVTRLIEVKEPAARLIGTIHSAGVVAVFGILAASLVWDVARLKLGKEGQL
jgi:hypothetical protein